MISARSLFAGMKNMSRNVEFIYEDNDILVCHKPAGVATEGAKSYTMDLVSSARNYLRRKQRTSGAGTDGGRGNGAGKPPYLATVHRLDQPVEGVVVLAKNKKAAGDIAAQIKNRTTDKYYYVLCYGTFDEASQKGKLTNYLIRREDNGLAGIVTEAEKDTLKDGVITMANGDKVRTVAGDVKKAELEYSVIATDGEKTLLNIKLLTGRFHQIRVQLSGIGHPILGESKYGTSESIACSEKCGIKDMCLVSYSFSLKHPGTGKRVTYKIEPDNEAIRKMLVQD